MDNFEDIRGYISNPRLSPYLDYCESNKMKALILYQMNLRLSAAFLPIISMLEVALRNAIDSRMTKNYKLTSEDNWIEQLRFDIQVAIRAEVIHSNDFHQLIGKIKNTRKGINSKIEKNIRNYLKRKYRSDKEYKKLDDDQKERKINSELNHIKYVEGIRIKKHVLVSKMDLGFWTTFFEPGLHGFLKGELTQIFNTDKLETTSQEVLETKRSKIMKQLDGIRKFRNRISHNEPIIFSGQKYDPTLPKQTKEDIMQILRGLNQNLQIFSEDIYTINTQLQKIEDYCDNIEKLLKK